MLCGKIRLSRKYVRREKNTRASLIMILMPSARIYGVNKRRKAAKLYHLRQGPPVLYRALIDGQQRFSTSKATFRPARSCETETLM